VDLKGVRRRRIAQIELQMAARAYAFTFMPCSKNWPGAPTVELSAVKRHVGILQEQVAAVAVTRRHGHFDAGAD
jgi:hypothetical protein